MPENTYSSDATGDYPPKHHVLRALQVSVELHVNGSSVIHAPVVPEVCTDRGGMMTGVIATLVDIVGGASSVREVYPDWIATAGLTVHTSRQAKSGRVSAVGSMIRAGNTMVVIDFEIREESGHSFQKVTPIGRSLISFSRLPRREDTIKLEFDKGTKDTYQFAFEGSELQKHLIEEVGAREMDEADGVVEVHMTDYVRNSFGALQGGLIAILADLSGQNAARAFTGKPMITSDLEIHYLSQGKVGPFRTKAKIIRATDETVLTRVEVIDKGVDDRMVGVAMNTSML
jgi:uncharacterized protein (TIGR00369 family)